MHSKLISQVVLFFTSYAIAMPCYCEISKVSAEKLNEMLSQKSALTIVDVRSGYDFQKSHILGAVNAAYNTIDKAALSKDGALVLYCGNDKCPLSHLAAKTLETLGYKNLMVLEGGIAAWTAKGFAVETAVGIQQKFPTSRRLTPTTVDFSDHPPGRRAKHCEIPSKYAAFWYYSDSGPIFANCRRAEGGNSPGLGTIIVLMFTDMNEPVKPVGF